MGVILDCRVDESLAPSDPGSDGFRMPASADSSLSTFSSRRTLSLPPRARSLMPKRQLSLLAASSRTTHPHSCLCRPKGRLQLADSMWRPTTSRARPHRPPSLHLKREALWPKLPGPWGNTTSVHGQLGPMPEHWRFRITIVALRGHTALLRPRSLLADFLSLHFCFCFLKMRLEKTDMSCLYLSVTSVTFMTFPQSLQGRSFSS